MRSAKNDEIESEVYDDFLAIDLTEEIEFKEFDNRAKKTSNDICIKFYCSM
jgi:hypothetical protein